MACGRLATYVSGSQLGVAVCDNSRVGGEWFHSSADYQGVVVAVFKTRR